MAQTPMPNKSPIPNWNGSFDLIRILAAFGIVWFHLIENETRFLGYAGLFVFLLLSAYLVAMTADKKPWKALIRNRALRLLVPWVFWSAFYLAFDLAREWRHGVPLGRNLTPFMLLSGGYLILWYFMFVFWAALAIRLCMDLTRRLSNTTTSALYGGFGIVVLCLMFMSIESLRLPPPLGEWRAAVPIIILGVFFQRSGLVENSITKILLRVGMLLAVLAICIHWREIPQSFSILLGVSVFAGSLWIKVPSSSTLRLWAGLSLGIYVLHPFISTCLFSFFGDIYEPIFLVFLVFFASALVVYGLKKTPLMRQFV